MGGSRSRTHAYAHAHTQVLAMSPAHKNQIRITLQINYLCVSNDTVQMFIVGCRRACTGIVALCAPCIVVDIIPFRNVVSIWVILNGTFLWYIIQFSSLFMFSTIRMGLEHYIHDKCAHEH